MMSKIRQLSLLFLIGICKNGFVRRRFNNMVLSEKIAFFRKNKGLKIAELAEKTRVSDDAVRTWERGTRIPDFDNLIKLADAFDVSLDVFRQDASRFDLPHPDFNNKEENFDEIVFNGFPLKFGSRKPDNQERKILEFCDAYLNTLDDSYFVKGVGQNSDYGTGRYFWENKIDLLMWIGFTSSNKEEGSEYMFSIAVNTEVVLPEDYIAEIGALQVTESTDENWVYVPICCNQKSLEKNSYPKELREATDKALFTAIKISRKAPDCMMHKFIMLKATINQTKLSSFEQ